jgi:hypothetical protein
MENVMSEQAGQGHLTIILLVSQESGTTKNMGTVMLDGQSKNVENGTNLR